MNLAILDKQKVELPDNRDQYLALVKKPFPFPVELFNAVDKSGYHIISLRELVHKPEAVVKIQAGAFKKGLFSISYGVNIMFSKVSNCYRKYYTYEIEDKNPESAIMTKRFIQGRELPYTKSQHDFDKLLFDTLASTYNNFTDYSYFRLLFDKPIPNIRLRKFNHVIVSGYATPEMVLYDDFWGYLEQSAGNGNDPRYLIQRQAMPNNSIELVDGIAKYLNKVFDLAECKKKYLDISRQQFHLPDCVIKLIDEFGYYIEAILESDTSPKVNVFLHAGSYKRGQFEIIYNIELIFTKISKVYRKIFHYKILNKDPDFASNFIEGESHKGFTSGHIKFEAYLDENLQFCDYEYFPDQVFMVPLEGLSIPNAKLREKDVEIRSALSTPYSFLFEDYWGYLEDDTPLTPTRKCAP